MIRAQDITYSYPGLSPVLEGVSFALAQGQTLGLAGANGSGKSTLLSLLAGLFVPEKGKLEIGGHDARNEVEAIRRRAGLVLQDPDLQIIGSTVHEDLFLGLDSRSSQEIEAARSLAERFGLGDIQDSPVQTLSHGQKKKLCLAASLAKKPELLLLDEPFSGLDYPAVREMRSILSASRDSGLTQILAVHDLEPVADLVDVWAVLHKGRLRLLGAATEVFPKLAAFDVRPPCSWQAGLGVKSWDWSL